MSDAATANEAVLNKEYLGPDSLRDELHAGLRDEQVDLNTIKEYFTPSAWRALQTRMAALRQCSWLCGVCAKSVEDVRSVGCDRCLLWFHYHCQGLAGNPTQSLYFCSSCKRA